MNREKDRDQLQNQLTDHQDPEMVLAPEYMYAPEAARYILSTVKKLALYRKYGLLKAGKLGKNYVYRKAWLDQFMDQWCGFDLSNEAAVCAAIKEKAWRQNHGLNA